jgi:prolycopene isomerase
MENRRVIVIGAGLSGLTAAALLSKKGIDVTVFDNQYQPGGGCGIFKRGPYTFDQGVGMFYGFGERGFNPHRYVMDILEEPIEMVRHEALYSLNYRGKRIVFWPDMERFYEELGKLLPESLPRIKEFYAHIIDLYDTVISKTVVFTSPAEMPRSFLLAQLLRHPVRQMRLLLLLRRSAAFLFRKFVSDPEVEAFFNKLTSTYSYTTLEETPAIMAITMFVDNHKGGSYYPVGGSAAVPARLEHAIEKYGGRIEYETLVTEILFEGGRAAGVRTAAGRELRADAVLYGGTIWNLYGRLLPQGMDMGKEDARYRAMEATYPSMVVYEAVDESVIPPGTLPVEMLASSAAGIDETEVTVYIPTLDDPSLAPRGEHLFLAIGPSLRSWPAPGSLEYDGKTRSAGYLEEKKRQEKRVLELIEERFPGIVSALRYVETATPVTIERYLLKNGGAVAGPKQRIGQELLNRPHARTRWPGLFLCGESTVMGTGAPAVTVSGISAANVILRDFGVPEYAGPPEKTGFVTCRDSDRDPGRHVVNEFSTYPAELADSVFSIESAMPADSEFSGDTTASVDREFSIVPLPEFASLCRWCDDAPCRIVCPAGGDIRGIMRRLQYGNLSGARRRLLETIGHACTECHARPCETVCRSGGRLTAGERAIGAVTEADSKQAASLAHGAGTVHQSRKMAGAGHLPIREIMLRLHKLPADPADRNTTPRGTAASARGRAEKQAGGRP